MRRAVAHRDRLRHAERFEFRALERDDVDRFRARRSRCRLEIDQRGGGVFDGREALIEPPRARAVVAAAPPASARRSGNAARSAAGFRAAPANARRAARETRRSRARRWCPRSADRSRPTTCRAAPWPNSWNSVRASSKLRRLASPSPPLAKFITLTTIGSSGAVELAAGRGRRSSRRRCASTPARNNRR